MEISKRKDTTPMLFMEKYLRHLFYVRYGIIFQVFIQLKREKMLQIIEMKTTPQCYHMGKL
jgi:hypothetical protein